MAKLKKDLTAMEKKLQVRLRYLLLFSCGHSVYDYVRLSKSKSSVSDQRLRRHAKKPTKLKRPKLPIHPRTKSLKVSIVLKLLAESPASTCVFIVIFHCSQTERVTVGPPR